MAPESAGEVPLLRPLSAEEGALRSTLLHGLLRAAETNLARGVRDIRLFEIGTTFHRSPGDPKPAEQTRVAALLSGQRRPRHWTGAAPDFDLWDARGLAAELAEALDPELRVGPLGGADVGDLALGGTYRPETMLAVRSEDELLGVAGEVAHGALDAPAWAGTVVALELRLTESMARRRRPTLVPVPTQPASDRDLALVVPAGVSAGEVAEVVREAAGPLLERLQVFDVYTGPGVPAGTRSVAYRLVFRHPERTLKDEEVDRSVDRVLQRLKNAHGVERRG